MYLRRLRKITTYHIVGVLGLGVPKYKIDSFLYLDENGVDIKDEILDLEEEYDEEYGEYYIYFTLNKNFTIVPVISNYDPT